MLSIMTEWLPKAVLLAAMVVVSAHTQESDVDTSSTSAVKSPSSPISQLRPCSEPITRTEDRLHTLGDRLEEKITRASEALTQRAGRLENDVFQRVASVETDMSSRMSRLEDRFSSILASHWDSTRPTHAGAEHNTEAFDDLKREVESIKSYMRNNSATGGQLTYQLDQRRAKGDVDFYRDWTSYREGFGAPTGDFWLGNEAIHKLTDQDAYELRIDIRQNGKMMFAQYSSFRIDRESSKYRLDLGSYTGDAGDGMAIHKGKAFTTFDRDNDGHRTVNCAINQHGAWWYQSCHHANLNGRWGLKETPGVSWHRSGDWLYPDFTEMKMRRVKNKWSP